ncbi:hypothetical protein DMENIID0001_059850 [Sergentomyia squamirostris]
MMDESEEHMEMDLPQSESDIFCKWGLSPAAIDRLLHCGITSYQHLHFIDSPTISKIFNEDSFLGDSIMFRMNLEAWRRANKFQILSGTNQSDLVEIIVETHLLHEKTLGREAGMEYAKQIVHLFPSENTKTYYVPSKPKEGVKNPKGKIASKVKNTKSKYKNIVEASKHWLQEHSEPWDEVTLNWKITSASRIQGMAYMDINEILESWTLYKHQEGYSLVAIDVQAKFSIEESEFSSKFEELRQQLLSILNEDMKDKSSRKLLEKIGQPLTNKDSADFILIRCINAILRPPRQARNKLFSIKDAQDAMVVYTNCNAEDALKKSMKDLGLSSTAPVLFVIALAETPRIKSLLRIFEVRTVLLSSVRVVQWNEDLYERYLIERTIDACSGQVDVVIDYGTTSRSLHRSLQCLADGGIVLLSDEVAERLVPKFSAKARERNQRIEAVKAGSVEQLRDIVDLVARGDLQPPPHTVFPVDKATEVVEKLSASEIVGRAILQFHDIE